jgi:hypothetical protein
MNCLGQPDAWQANALRHFLHRSTLTLELDGSLVRSLEESARREHKPEETEAEGNGYSTAWLKLFGTDEDESFSVPTRGETSPVGAFEALQEWRAVAAILGALFKWRHDAVTPGSLSSV